MSETIQHILGFISLFGTSLGFYLALIIDTCTEKHLARSDFCEVELLGVLMAMSGFMLAVLIGTSNGGLFATIVTFTIGLAGVAILVRQGEIYGWQQF